MKHTTLAIVMLGAIALIATACGNPPAPTPLPVILPTATSVPPTATTAPTATKPPTVAPTTASASKVDPATIQLRYTMMALNVHQLGELVDKWSGGDDGARAEASERMERLDQLTDFSWPSEMTNGVKGFKGAMGDLDKALTAKDKANAPKAYNALNDAFDSASHPFYGKWMPAMMSGGKMMNDQISVQATYLGMAFNVNLLDGMMARWNKSDDAARTEMGEMLERLDTMVGYVTWPSDLNKGVTTFKGSMDALDQAVKAKDMKTAQSALNDLKGSFDGVAHPYYGKYMMGMLNMKTSDAPSVSAAFLDLALNEAGLAESLTAWKGGDDGARSEASEKFERLDAIFDSVQWPDALAKSVTAFKTSLAPVQTAVKAKDAAGALKAFADAGDAFDAVAHPYYKWLAASR